MSGQPDSTDDDGYRLPRWLALTAAALRVLVLAGKVAALLCRLIRLH